MILFNKSIHYYAQLVDPAINMDFTNIPEYINRKQNRCTYLYLSNPTLEQLKASVCTDITVEIDSYTTALIY